MEYLKFIWYIIEATIAIINVFDVFKTFITARPHACRFVTAKLKIIFYIHRIINIKVIIYRVARYALLGRLPNILGKNICCFIKIIILMFYLCSGIGNDTNITNISTNITNNNYIIMLYIKKLNSSKDNLYYGIPTTESELNSEAIFAAPEKFIMHTNRILTACVVTCGLATVWGHTKLDMNGNKKVVGSVSAIPYLACGTHCEPFSEAFNIDAPIGNRVLISNTSFNSGSEIFVRANTLSGAINRSRLAEISKRLFGSIDSQFDMVKIEDRFLDKETGERLVFFGKNEPYSDQKVLSVDYRSYATSVCEGLGDDTLDATVGTKQYIFEKITTADGDWYMQPFEETVA